MSQSFDLSKILQLSPQLSLNKKIKYAWFLSVPGIMAQISSIVMQYIDTAMVGHLGENASASIGLIISSTWLIGSIISSSCIGFSVQVAQATGAGEQNKARQIVTQGITFCLILDVLLMTLASFLSPYIPQWLGASQAIAKDASIYFFIYALSIPLYHIVYLLSASLQGTGDMKTPSILNALMCLFDVVFNYIYIYVLKKGVFGAALGSASAAFVITLFITYYTFLKNDYLKLKKQKWSFYNCYVYKTAVKIALPVAVESSAFTGALVLITKIIAPLGSAALAANSFAVTAESLCYMPGYGIQEASTTMTGQSIGAKRTDLAKSFAWITVSMGMIIMTLTGIVMYIICPWVMSILTPVREIRDLGVKVLRIELFAEPLYGAAIVSSGALSGIGDTLIPGIMNLVSVWIVRLTLSILLVKNYGLTGIWIAMTSELCFRGIIFLIRLTTKLK